MSSDEYQRQELGHIERMIIELERLPEDERIAVRENPVMNPEYWRKRINVLMTSPNATRLVIRDAATLLQRLARIAAPTTDEPHATSAIHHTASKRST
ncbi:hypothetical protein BGLT_01985 [Caballeronia glathei]|nr:hypothetical protein [Caballeronia glathei]CDY79289.1 hypothetical protein BGLT_01985 [Caballeronia glathei]